MVGVVEAAEAADAFSTLLGELSRAPLGGLALLRIVQLLRHFPLLLLLFFTLCVPFLIFYCYDAARLKEIIGEADETETFIGSKGVDHSLGQVASGFEFWYTCVISMIVIGSAKMVVENTGPFALGD